LLCDEHGICGSGESCDDNDSDLGSISFFYHEALGGKCVLRAFFFSTSNPA
jgi:hypothetical protein